MGYVVERRVDGAWCEFRRVAGRGEAIGWLAWLQRAGMAGRLTREGRVVEAW